MINQKDSVSDGVSEAAPERVRLVIRAATSKDWIGVAYVKDYTGNPSTIHDYARVHQPPASEGLERVKKVPLTSTWSCPTCNRQNIYREGVVSDPQNKCAACGTEVIVGAIRSTDQPPELNVEDKNSGETQQKAPCHSQTAILGDSSLSASPSRLETCPQCEGCGMVEADAYNAEHEFLQASVAVWQEIDKGGPPLDSSVELRKRERAAWEKYRDTQDVKSGVSPAVSVDTVESSVPHHTESATRASDASKINFIALAEFVGQYLVLGGIKDAAVGELANSIKEHLPLISQHSPKVKIK